MSVFDVNSSLSISQSKGSCRAHNGIMMANCPDLLSTTARRMLISNNGILLQSSILYRIPKLADHFQDFGNRRYVDPLIHLIVQCSKLICLPVLQWAFAGYHIYMPTNLTYVGAISVDRREPYRRRPEVALFRPWQLDTFLHWRYVPRVPRVFSRQWKLVAHSHLFQELPNAPTIVQTPGHMS